MHIIVTRSSMRWSRLIAVVLAIIALWFAPAVPQTQPQTPQTQPQTPQTQPQTQLEPSSLPQEPITYRLGLLEAPSTVNPWAAFGDASAFRPNEYVFSPLWLSLYKYGPQRFDWIPSLAADFPTSLIREGNLWASEVRLKQEVLWSDGTELTAEDVKFTYDVTQVFQLSEGRSIWSNWVNLNLLDHVEIVDHDTVKFYLRARTLFYQFSILMAPIMQQAYWEPIVIKAFQSEDPVGALLSFESLDVPTTGGFVFSRWQQGALGEFVEHQANPNYSFQGETVTLYEDGAVEIVVPKLNYKWVGYGPAEGLATLEVTEGPYVDRVVYRFYGNEVNAVSALESGEVDMLLTPLALDRKFRDQLAGAPLIASIQNRANEFRYLSFNIRREPFDILEFRQAVATLIDREFVAEQILQGAVFPLATVIPSGNPLWHNSDVQVLGQGLSQAERVAEAVDLLKSAGFKWIKTPRVKRQEDTIEIEPGRGIILPNGRLAPEVELLAPTPEFDPLRATFALWIERWLTDLGIPIKLKLIDFDQIVDQVFQQQDFDMQILGWRFNLIFPDYIRDLFHSTQMDPGFYNHTGYSSPEFDELADRFILETDIRRGQEIARQIQALVAEELPYIVLFDLPFIEFYRDDRIEFPYTEVLNGIQRLNGAPTLVQVK
ncbi:MAG: ABC transporter substrate-binding protein [Candidatus Bipolaricaulia bacterium]